MIAKFNNLFKIIFNYFLMKNQIKFLIMKKFCRNFFMLIKKKII